MYSKTTSLYKGHYEVALYSVVNCYRFSTGFTVRTSVASPGDTTANPTNTGLL